MNEDATIFGFIKEQIPAVNGYGVTGQTTVDGVTDHDIFYQSIREDHEGDIGIFMITGQEDKELIYGKMLVSEIQVVVNSVNGDIAGVLNMLMKTLENIRKNKKNSYVYVQRCELINLCPVGKNSNGLQWDVMNILCKYMYLEQGQ